VLCRLHVGKEGTLGVVELEGEGGELVLEEGWGLGSIERRLLGGEPEGEGREEGDELVLNLSIACLIRSQNISLKLLLRSVHLTLNSPRHACHLFTSLLHVLLNFISAKHP